MKKETSTLARKLRTYSAVAGTLLATGKLAEAQVVYTDIAPDDTVDLNTVYALDLNNDGTADYGLAFYTAGTTGGVPRTGVFAIPYSGNGIAGSNNASVYYYPSLLAAGNAIGNSLTFATHYPLQTMGTHYFYFQGTYGNWFGATDGYMGLFFNDGGTMKYGWVRLDVGAVGTPLLIVKDYAYEDSGNSILAGDDGTGIPVVANGSNGVRIFGFEGTANIVVEGSIDNAKATVTNILGQEVVSTLITSANTRIDLNQFGKGVYVISVLKNDQLVTSKVSIR